MGGVSSYVARVIEVFIGLQILEHSYQVIKLGFKRELTMEEFLLRIQTSVSLLVWINVFYGYIVLCIFISLYNRFN